MIPQRNRRLRAFPRRHSIRTGCVLPPLPTMMKSTLSLSACGNALPSSKSKTRKIGGYLPKIPGWRCSSPESISIAAKRHHLAGSSAPPARALRELGEYAQLRDFRECLRPQPIGSACAGRKCVLCVRSPPWRIHTPSRPTIPGIICCIVPTMRPRRHTKASIPRWRRFARQPAGPRTRHTA